jgi:broad specificity phosphatase PhoE
MNNPTIYLLRHPETTWNVEGRFQGRLEGEITDEGKKEAEEFVHKLSIPTITHIYHADNKRTSFFAKMIQEKYPEAELLCDVRLNERDCGDYEGKLYTEIYSEKEEVKDFESRYTWKPPHGESHEEVGNRVYEYYNELLNTYTPRDVIVCVTSSGVIKNLLQRIHALSLSEMYQLKIPNLHLEKL